MRGGVRGEGDSEDYGVFQGNGQGPSIGEVRAGKTLTMSMRIFRGTPKMKLIHT